MFFAPSRQDAKMIEPDQRLDALARVIVDSAFRLHRDIGPGLLESAYEALLAAKLTAEGVRIDRQVPVDACFEGIKLPAAYRIDLLVERSIVIEIKSVEKPSPAHAKQVLTYLKLGGFPLGFIINFWNTHVQGRYQTSDKQCGPLGVLATWREHFG